MVTEDVTLTEIYAKYANYLTLTRKRLGLSQTAYGELMRPDSPIHYNLVAKYERQGFRKIPSGQLEAWYLAVKEHEKNLSVSKRR